MQKLTETSASNVHLNGGAQMVVLISQPWFIPYGGMCDRLCIFVNFSGNGRKKSKNRLTEIV